MEWDTELAEDQTIAEDLPTEELPLDDAEDVEPIKTKKSEPDKDQEFEGVESISEYDRLPEKEKTKYGI